MVESEQTKHNSFKEVLQIQPSNNWQRDYQKLHQDILSGRLPPRYLIIVLVEAGLADQITGIVTAFFYALHSRRAIQILPYGHLIGYESTFDYSMVNWTVPNENSYPEEAYHHLKFSRSWNIPRVPSTNFSYQNNRDYASEYLVNIDIAPFYLYSNLSFVNEDAKYVFLTSNRGMTFRMFENPYHSEQLFEMGLRPELAFFTGFNYLFKPNAEVKRLMHNISSVLDSEKNALKIGIQIRVGDANFQNDGVVALEPFDRFFSCAQEIENSRALGRKVLWYLVSESLELRKLAKLKYGDKLITNTVDRFYHIDCTGYNAQLCAKDSVTDIMQAAAADILLFSKTHYHVISANSGFGRNGAWLSPRWHHVFLINDSPRPCGIGQHDSYETLSSAWSGI